jgi:SAM-dependent methyltransferase
MSLRSVIGAQHSPRRLAAVTTIDELDRRYYTDYVDEHQRFDALVRTFLRPDAAVLDAGAGRGVQFPFDYREHVARMAGVDVDPAVLENPCLTDAAVADMAHLPFDDASFDVVFSKYVFEHLTRPAAAMRELRRVLKPGGHMLVHTPNARHYVALASRFTPYRFHVWFMAKRGRVPQDSFRIAYRANSRAVLERLAMESGFRVVSIEFVETKPDYLFFSPVAYRAGIAYERLVNRFELLAPFRVQLIANLEAV